MAELPEWLVESLRCTSFFSEPAPSPNDVTWWTQVVGAEPSDVALRPREGESQWSGEVQWHPLEPATLDLQLQPVRADWRLQSIPKADQPLGFNSIGPLPEASAILQDKLAPWLQSCPASLRLAYGGVLLLPAESVSAAYDRLSGFLPSLKLDPDSRDLLYRINRPRASKSLPGLEAGINRLTTWGVVTLKSLLITLPANTLSSQEGGSAIRLEFDMNTAPTRTDPLPAEGMGAIVTELAELAIESATQGDIS